MSNAEKDAPVVDREHRWFEYGRWFYGFGSSMDPHICGEDGTVCEWRERIVTVTPWSDWTVEGCAECGGVIDRTIPDPIPEGYECMWSEAMSGKALYCQACYSVTPPAD